MGRVSQIKSDNERYGFKPLSDTSKKRLDLNSLLKRVKDEEKRNKKLNLLIFTGSASVVLVIFVLFSL